MTERAYNVTFVTDYTVSTVTVVCDFDANPSDLTTEQTERIVAEACILAASDGVTLRPKSWEEVSHA